MLAVMAVPLDFHAVTPVRWDDLARLFTNNGNPNYCWCQLWRLPSAEYRHLRSPERKAALQASVEAGTPVGILGYLEGEPVGWCSVAPRPSYLRLMRSRSIPQLDDKVTWSIVCLFFAHPIRGQDRSAEFLRAAVEYAKAAGAEVVEGYPVDPILDAEGNRQPAQSYRFMGYTSSYLKAGFQDVTPPGAARHIMRYKA